MDAVAFDNTIEKVAKIINTAYETSSPTTVLRSKAGKSFFNRGLNTSEDQETLKEG